MLFGSIDVQRYVKPDGEVPISEWLASLRDARAKTRLLVRMRRLSVGLSGDWKPVGGGVFELREDVGPGYRVYCGRRSRTFVLLLCGGDKSSQSVDIGRAKAYWTDWKQREL